MQLHYHFHGITSEAFSPEVASSFQALCDALQGLPYLFWPGKSLKGLEESVPPDDATEAQKAQQESLQSLYNVWLKQSLQASGFEAECLVRGPYQNLDRQKVDFARLVEGGNRMMVEIEFGYTASIERNFLKLLDAFHHGRCALGVLVCPVQELAKATASGVASFSTAVRRLQSFHPDTLAMPLVVVGLDATQTPRIDLSQSLVSGPEALSGNSNKAVLWHVVEQLRAGRPVEQISVPNAGSHRTATRALKARSTLLDLQGQLQF